MTINQILDAAISHDLSKVDQILSVWRGRRWITDLKSRKRFDLACRVALRMLERAYPGKVWPKLTINEPELIDNLELN